MTDGEREAEAAAAAASATRECPMRMISRPFMHDPYPVLRALQRDAARAVPVLNNGFRMWVVTRYEEVRAILADSSVGKDIVQRRRAVSTQSLLRPERRARFAPTSRRSVLDRDGADHRRLRLVLGGVFSPARLVRYRERLEQIAAEVLAELPVEGTVDVIAEYARPLSGRFVSELLGVPEGERDDFPRWETDMLTAPTVDAIEAAGRNLYEFAQRMIEHKRREPGDDLFTRLLDVRREQRMTEDELASTFIMLLVAGSEPTTAVGNGLLLLLSHPDQLAAAHAMPDGFARAVEETVRFESPFRMLPPRFSDRPLHIGEVEIPAGELVLTSVAAANRDPGRFPDPDRFDITRQTRGHLGFGHGEHRCLGAQLGRAETEIGLRALLRRYPRAALGIAPDQAEWRLGTFMRRLDNLPVQLDSGRE